MPKLVIKSGAPQAQEFELKPGKNYVGRGFASDLKLEDASVSGSHAVIEVNGSVVIITDLGSTNGTRINGLPATGTPLQSGQVLKLGAVELLFVADATAGVTLTAASPPTAAAKQIATEFFIRDPSHVGVASAPPPALPPTPPSGELRIPGIPPVESAPPPVPLATAPPPPAPVPVKAPPPPAPVIAAPAAPAPLPVARESKAAAAPPAPAPAPVPVVPTPVLAAPSPQRISATLVEAPSGKTMCKFHTNKPAQWLCQKCNESFCLLCVEAKPTSGGVGYFCRKCQTQCVALKVTEPATAETKLQVHLETAVLLRTIGCGFGGALVGAGIWTGIAAATGFDQPAVFAPLTGIACGYGVKLASQDRPGLFFSITAAFAALIGTGIGKTAALIVTHRDFVFNAGSLGLAVFGVALGMFLAWKVGGGDF